MWTPACGNEVQTVFSRFEVVSVTQGNLGFWDDCSWVKIMAKLGKRKGDG
jgi:hypothetical protein